MNEFRAGHAYNNNPIAGALSGLEVIDSLGITGLAPGLPSISGVLKVSFPGTALTGLSQVDWRNPGFLNRSNQIQNQTTWLRGTHSLKFGAEIRRVDWEELNAPANLFGNSTSRAGSRRSRCRGERSSVCRFPVRRAEHRVARVSAGARAAHRAGPTTSSCRTTGRVARNLTVNLGLRYDIHPGWYERNGRLATFDVTSGKIVDPRGRTRQGLAADAGGVRRRRHRRQRRVALAHARPDRPQQHRAAPRLRLAAVRRREHRRARRLRSLLRHDADRSAASATPFVFQETTFTNPAIPTVVLPAVFPAAGTSGPATIALPLAVNPDLQLPYSHQWNATVEHERWGTGFRAVVRRHAGT